MRRAFSLPELVLVLAVAGIVLSMAVPQLSRARDRIQVQAAAHHIAAAHQRARLMAVTQGRVVVLSVNQAELAIRRREADTTLWVQAGPAAHGVELAGSTRQFTFSPAGLTLGLSNATLRLTRGSATRTVVVSRLGRVRIVR
ncbi:MAG: pilus assembly FimT family protein [Gemmatimonadales bacterium]